ncbi:MAG: hypothetical protein JW876_11230 [Candidatus Krumholzibacteriota bacterium]|nr:hypothetical protein [Candidatus Krumholzibacteriota bacterium]
MTSRGNATRRATAMVAMLLLLPTLCSCSNGGGGKETETRGAELSVIFGSDLLGKIRSCGCALEDMGGLGRRATYIEEVRNSVDNLLVVDAGDAFSLDLAFSRDEAALLFESYDLMGTDVMTPGELEFIFGVDYLLELGGRVGFDLVAANVVDPSTGEPLLGPPWTVRTLEGGLRVAITGVLDDSIRFPGYIDTSGFEVRPVRETLDELLPAMRREADFLILLCHTGLDRARDIVAVTPGFDIVVIGHGKPVIKKREIEGETIMLATGGQGQYVGRIDLVIDGHGGTEFGRLQIVPLRDEIAIHEGVAAIFRSYGVSMEDLKTDRK